MTDSPCVDNLAVRSHVSKIETNMDPDINHSPKKNRHIIKGTNIKPVGCSEKSRSSPLSKSLHLIGRISNKGKTKSKNPTSLNERYEDSDIVTKAAGDDVKSSVAVGKGQQACSSSKVEKKISETDTSTSHSKLKKKSKKKAESKKKEPVKSHVLTEYYPVRRSTRRSRAVIEKEQTEYIIGAIKTKAEDGLAIKEFPEKGRGVVAKRSFRKGAFIVEYAGELIDWTEAKHREEEYSKDSSVGCYMYYFVYNNTNYCVDATAESGRLGRLLNHSRKNPNCKTRLIPMSGIEEEKSRPKLIIIANRDIAAGEELTYDYGDRDKQTLQSHPWLKST